MDDRTDLTGRATDAEVAKRVYTVSQMLTVGYKRQEILQFCAEKYDVQERQADTYIARARDVIKEEVKADLDYHRAVVEKRLEDLFLKNYKIQDYRECRQLVNDIAKFHGVHGADKVDVTSDGNEIKLPPWLQNLAD